MLLNVFGVILFVSVSLNNAILPIVHERQPVGDIYCYIYAFNNVVQKEGYFNKKNVKELATWLNERVPMSQRNKLLTEAGSIAVTKRGNKDAYLYKYMFNYAGYQFPRVVEDYIKKPIHTKPKYKTAEEILADQHMLGPRMTGEAQTELQQYQDEIDQLKNRLRQIMRQDNFQGFLIQLNYYEAEHTTSRPNWKHFTSITRNDDHLFYIDPAFPVIDVHTPQQWTCGRHQIQSVTRDLPASYPNKQKRNDCDRLEEYGLDAIKYLASRYLGELSATGNGIENAIDRLIELFYGCNARHGRGVVAGQFKLVWAAPIYKFTTDAERLEFSNRYLNIYAPQAVADRTLLKKQQSLYPNNILEVKRRQYQEMWTSGWGFYSSENGGVPNQEGDRMTLKTCKILVTQPQEWTLEEVRRALKCEWRRRQESCASAWHLRPVAASSAIVGEMNNFDYDNNGHYQKYNLGIILIICTFGFGFAFIGCCFFVGVAMGYVLGKMHKSVLQ